MWPRWCWLGLLGLVSACSGETGVLAVTLTEAPGSTLLDSVQQLRMTLTNPRQVTTADRTAHGFEISLELPASGEDTAILVEGFDAGGALVANGASPAFPTGALNGRIVIYMAPPLSVGASPAVLSPARSEVAAAPLTYGAIFAGGRLETGPVSDAISIYNAFDHSVVVGLPMPAPRTALALATGGNNAAYMFGGSDDADAPTADLWRFDTNARPNGAYLDYGAKDAFARTGQSAVPLANEQFLITGAPPAQFSGLNGEMIARDEIAALPAAGVSLIANDGKPTSIFAGPSGVVRFREGTFTTLSIPEAARPDANVVALPGGKVLVVCGTTDAVRIDAASGDAETLPNIPSVAKTGCAAAATSRFLIIAGGTAAGTIDGTVEIFDAATLAPITTAPLTVPRTNAVAIALPNGQILIASGLTPSNAPVSTLELFTPPVN
ncbi:MAG TPA: hypothetical protein VFV99_28680 [Kofleriaceae bacterium]|nr:hypothetical protein [Kofleriaceae bacterium]